MCGFVHIKLTWGSLVVLMYVKLHTARFRVSESVIKHCSTIAEDKEEPLSGSLSEPRGTSGQCSLGPELFGQASLPLVRQLLPYV